MLYACVRRPGVYTMRYDPLYFKKLGGKSHRYTVGGLTTREGTETGRLGVTEILESAMTTLSPTFY